MERIVVGVDGSRGARAALAWGLDEARLWGAGLEAVTAYDSGDQPHVAGRRTPEPAADAAELLSAVVRDVAGDDPGVGVEQVVEAGHPATVLVRRSLHSGLLVLGNRGRGGFASLLLGSVGQACLTHACVPTAVVRPGWPRHEGGPHAGAVVVGVDGSVASERALRWAVDEARRRHASLEVLYAIDFPTPRDPDERRGDVSALDTTDERLASFVGAVAGDVSDLDVVRTVREGPPAATLVERAAAADLVVLGARGAGGFADLLLGSTASQVSRHAACPVVVVPLDRPRPDSGAPARAQVADAGVDPAPPG